MATTTSSTVAAELESYFSKKILYAPGAKWYTGTPTKTYHSEPWQPPHYTSMAGWYFLNYTLLACLMTLIGCVIYGITRLF